MWDHGALERAEQVEATMTDIHDKTREQLVAAVQQMHDLVSELHTYIVG